MYYKLIADEMGDYVNAAGQRFFVASARRVRNVQGVNVGYTEFPSLEDALEYWGLEQTTDALD